MVEDGFAWAAAAKGVLRNSRSFVLSLDLGNALNFASNIPRLPPAFLLPIAGVMLICKLAACIVGSLMQFPVASLRAQTKDHARMKDRETRIRAAVEEGLSECREEDEADQLFTTVQAAVVRRVPDATTEETCQAIEASMRIAAQARVALDILEEIGAKYGAEDSDTVLEIIRRAVEAGDPLADVLLQPVSQIAVGSDDTRN